jgi:intracellular septation protein
MNAKSEPQGGAKLLIDLGPLLVFFVVNFFAPVPGALKIFVATGAFMVAMMAAMLISQLKYRHISPLLWFSGLMVVVLGGLTIWLHDDTFIKLKLTVVNALFGLILLVGLLLKKPLVKYLLGEALRLTDEGWRVLTRWWIAYFFFLAALNEAVWRNTTTDTWVSFKNIALPVLTLLFFFFALSPVIARHSEPEPGSPGGEA